MMLAFAQLRSRWSGFVGSFVVIVLGVALVTTTLLVIIASEAKVPDRLADTPIVVTQRPTATLTGSTGARQPWENSVGERLASDLQGVDGVDSAIVDRSFYAQVVKDGKPIGDDEDTTAGHGWSSTKLAPYRLTTGTAPDGPHDVVVDDSLGIGVDDTVGLLTASGERAVTVTGTVDGPGVYVSESMAERLSPGAAAIGLTLDRGTSSEAVASDVDDIAGSADVLTGQQRSALESPSLAKIRAQGGQLLSAMALLGAFVSVFVVASTFAFDVARRRRELALLRVIGATPRQIRGMILGEAAVTGVIGSIVGAVVGVIGGPPVGALLKHLELTDPALHVQPAFVPIGVAVIMGVVVALAGAASAGQRASRVVPMKALRSAQVESRGTTRAMAVLGSIALAVGVVFAVITVMTEANRQLVLGLVTAMILTVAAALLAPFLIVPAVKFLSWPVRRCRGAATMLVRSEILNAPRRAGSIAAPIILTIGFATLISALAPTISTAYPAGVTAALSGQKIVQPVGTPGLSEPLVQDITRGTDQHVAALYTQLFVDDPSMPGEANTIVDAQGRLAPSDHTSDGLVVQQQLADQFGWATGDSVRVGFVDGTSEHLPITKIIETSTAQPPVSLSRSIVRSHDRSTMTDDLFIAAQDAPDDAGPRAESQDAKTFADREYADDARLFEQFSTILLILAVGYSALSVANTIGMAAHARRGDLAVLRGAGGTIKQIVGLISAETFLIGLIGALLGLTATMPPLAAIAAGLEQTTGVPVSIQLDWATFVPVTVGTLALATAAAATITHRSLRNA
ncbi:FtsX-like permease family protein [Brevibacterium marinum]|uniref:Putative ABC transport system permease protein n=1 Tax=Brevibacterium marinum TaxID=418643 RepID=A0A846RXP1_9MICO|nr:FtsX-like permease family protein [Brevibacterium marinum]NJC55658.1 putative ABC transport system permease protein [Brevibacterium marinum]